MKHLLTLLATLTMLAAPAAAQTMKALMFSTNGTVVANTGTLTFTNSSVFPQINSPDLNADNMTVEGAIYFTETLTNVSVTRANLGFSTNLNTLWTATNASNSRSAIGLGATWLTNTNVTNFRTAIGLPLAALTNTSNVTLMRALAGSTNTNQPYSGIIQYADSPTGDIYEMTVSNGIILKTEMQ